MGRTFRQCDSIPTLAMPWASLIRPASWWSAKRCFRCLIVCPA